MAGGWPTHGYCRITVQLRRDKGGTINSKRVRQLMAEMGIQGTIKCSIRGWRLSHSLDQGLTPTALNRALGTGHVPEIHHSDQGVQYATTQLPNYHDAYRQIGRFLDEVYIHKRIHSSLDYLPPVEFEQQWLAGHAVATDVVPLEQAF